MSNRSVGGGSLSEAAIHWLVVVNNKYISNPSPLCSVRHLEGRLANPRPLARMKWAVASLTVTRVAMEWEEVYTTMELEFGQNGHGF